jgi:hypothetical protein
MVSSVISGGGDGGSNGGGSVGVIAVVACDCIRVDVDRNNFK